MKKSNKVKVQVHCPKGSEDKVRLAIGKAGGGQEGNYHYCAFVSHGEGHFLPMEGANPTIGKIGKMEKVEEVKVEFVCEVKKLKQIINSLKKAHPYEHPSIAIFPLLEVD